MQWLVNTAVLLLLILSLGWWRSGETIRRWMVLHDLSEYARVVRRSDIHIDDKEKLLGRIYSIEDSVRGGRLPPYWSNCDEAMRQLLADSIDTDEVRLIVLELDRTRVNSGE